MQDNIPNKDQRDTGSYTPVTEEAIDNIALGAPFDKDPDNTNDAPRHPAVGTATATDLDPQPTEPPCPQIKAGCVWDSDNWSCAYDAIFMSLLFIYRNSSSGWRNKWRKQAPKWNTFLGGAFDYLLSMAQDNRTPQAALSRKFTSFRETFRDELSRINPAYFQRHGMISASVCQILSHIFSDSVVCEPHLDQVAACDQCGITTHSRCLFALLGSTVLLDWYLNEDDTGPLLPLQTAVTRYVECFSQEPQRDHCSTCSGPLRVESLSIPETTWLWIELDDLESPIAPSPRLVFGFRDQRHVYTLQSVIYLGGHHFTARLSDRSDMWWKYDGQWKFGTPCVDRVKDEVDLLVNDGRHAAFLLYSRADVEG